MTRTTLKCLIVAVSIPVVIAVLVFGYIISRIGYQSYQHNFVRERVLFAIPDTQIEIEHSRLGNHLFLAEYVRDITFIKNGQRIKTSPLGEDTCGGYPINCYLIKNPDSTFLRLVDGLYEHMVDLNNQSVYLVTRGKDQAYYGEFNPDDTSTVWNVYKQGSTTFLEVSVGGRPTRPLAQLIGDATEQYMGRLDGKAGKLRFIPATEAPEIEID